MLVDRKGGGIYIVKDAPPWPKEDTNDLLTVLRLSKVCGIAVRYAPYEQEYILQFVETGETSRYKTSGELKEAVLTMADAIHRLRLTR